MAEMQVFCERRTVLGDNVVYTENDFFRPENVSGMRLATEVAPAYLDAQGRNDAFRLVDIGCSRAMDTWSTATAFIAAGVKARIRAVDINPHVLAKAQQPYAVTRDYLEERIDNWKLPASCLDLFEVIDDDHIQPGPELRAMVTFGQLDAREQSLGVGFDAATANNVLSYYTMKNRHHLGPMVGNIASAVAIGGHLTVGTFFPTFEPTFGDHGFVPAERWNVNPAMPNFFVRQPLDVA